MNIKLKKIITIPFCIFLLLLSVWICFLNYIEPTQMGITRNWINGKMSLQETPGWYFSAPWVFVAKIQTTPIRVCVSTASRGYNAKLVQFNPKEWFSFVQTEGWYYYWWYNRLSFNWGYTRDEEFRGFRDVMRGYAYSSIEYPFIKVLDEYQQKQKTE